MTKFHMGSVLETVEIIYRTTKQWFASANVTPHLRIESMQEISVATCVQTIASFISPRGTAVAFALSIVHVNMEIQMNLSITSSQIMASAFVQMILIKEFRSISKSAFIIYTIAPK